jgi:hypothetical protein
MARTKHTVRRPDPAGATALEKAEALKAKAKAVAKALAPKKEIKKPAKKLAKKPAKTPTKAAGKKAAKAAHKTPTKANKEVCECGRDERDGDRAMVQRWLEGSSGRAERCAEREKARRSLEESFANADRRAEARRALGLEKGEGEAQVAEDISFQDALVAGGRVGDEALDVFVKLITSAYDETLEAFGVGGRRPGTPEGSPPPEPEPVTDTVEYYKAQEQKGKEAVVHERYPSTEPEDMAVVVAGESAAGESAAGGGGQSSGEGGGQVRVGRVVGRKLRLAEFRPPMRVVTQPEAAWRFTRWVGTVVDVGCGLDGQLVCVQVDGELYENELASGVVENRVGRLVVPCRSTEGTGKNGMFSIETYWEAHELREVTGDTGVGSVLVGG